MGQTPRPIKTAGYATYQDAVANNFPDIIDADLDLDIQTLYDLCNGQLDDTNINRNLLGAKIVYEKLNLHGKIQPSDLVSGFVLPVSTLPTITITQLGLGAATQAAPTQLGQAGVNMAGDGAEHVLAEVTWTARGGYILVLGTLNANFILGQQGSGTVISRLRLDAGGITGTPITASGSQLAGTTHNIGWAGPAGAVNMTNPLSATLFGLNGLKSGALHAQLTGALTPGSANAVCQLQQPSIVVMEFA